MRIAIPMNEMRMESEVCVSFGRAPYFLVYDTQSDVSNFFENPGAASQGGQESRYIKQRRYPQRKISKLFRKENLHL